jgi:hypothetical protein
LKTLVGTSLVISKAKDSIVFRRIELIDQMSAEIYDNMIKAMQERGEGIDKSLTRFWKSGLMGFGHELVTEAWIQMNNPRRTLFKNCRFYFTEAGWRQYGRPTVRACQQTDQQYRVISIKEHSVDVVYRDEFQVAVRPKKKKASTHIRRAR